MISRMEFNSFYFSFIILYTNMALLPSSKESIMNKQKHLNLEARVLIESLLNQHHSFKSIARELGKDCTTISKEIRGHISFEKTGALGRSFNDCRSAFLHQCSLQKFCQKYSYSNNRLCWTCGKCTSSCLSYEKYICPDLFKPPYVCNGCQQRSRCSLEKNFYKASYAQKEYELLRSESRSGFALSEAELKQLDDVVSPLLIKRQSLHHISVHHTDELMKSERTLYAYINSGLFTARTLDMPRTVRMRPEKMFPKNLRLTNPAGSVVIFSALKIFWLNIPMFLSGRLTLWKARKAVQSFSPFISSCKDCNSFFSENAMIHSLSLTFSTACISNCFLIVSSLFFLSCWRITAVNFQTLPRSNWTPREIGEQICSTAMSVLLIRKEAARATMN